MKKLIRQQDEKNKIIEEIEKNLRVIYSKYPKNQKTNKKTKNNHLSLHFDLPTINVRHGYSPKSHNISLQKRQKYCGLSTKQQFEQLSKRKSNKPWINTINFQVEDRSLRNTVVLINQRLNLRKFMLSTQRIEVQTLNVKQKQQFVLTPNNFLLTYRQVKARDTQKQSWKNNLRKSKNKSALDKKVVQPEKNQDIHRKHSQQIIKQIISTQLIKDKIKEKQKQKQKQRQREKQRSKQRQKQRSKQKLKTFESKDLQTLNFLTTRYNNNKKLLSRGKKTYSPWNSGDQAQALVQQQIVIQ